MRAIAAAHLPSEPIVRVPAAEGWLVKRVLDAGARTLMFPNVESAEEAARIVRLTQYPTAEARDGLRGVAGAVRAAAYGMRRDYMTTANAQIATIVQIESAAALEAVEQIAATPGVDCLFIGPADLAASLGHLGDAKHPDVQAAIDEDRRCGEARGHRERHLRARCRERAAVRAGGHQGDRAGVGCDVAVEGDASGVAGGSRS